MSWWSDTPEDEEISLFVGLLGLSEERVVVYGCHQIVKTHDRLVIVHSRKNGSDMLDPSQSDGSRKKIEGGCFQAHRPTPQDDEAGNSV